jgi:hypothetical protein
VPGGRAATAAARRKRQSSVCCAYAVAMTRGRPLTENERVVLARLLSGEFPGADAFRAQIAATSVTGVCGCGCSSLTLAVDHTKANPAPDQDPDWDIIIENGGSTSWLMVHQKGGWLAELEHVPGHGLGPGSVDPSEVFPEPWE